ncbi:phenylalanine--tRNA ligase subunit beta [Candidatus Woesearchaeota archaeon]|jgi:phenylalanyl-tRNA synthetase beta chain|nr:phenylalanine--tRNA ligase subunit beta [Candidatus Woesearchaeota archaeon]MBT4387307.1 phenylalanine--tRNA ligase subunit beta [Candidatus Woesearchaeota archaeon]MBT4595446.1 phenylalanine--tRNA ligase subunit beta [Candidatus Woesearchaeota archaeon]MBT5741161.1 phenylalanine--tRNA ligase subunit beta [Candidatus Woesearchaeota archaeon]MBT6505927.1 phenylalanine--tRNA ligase subunit beta [Candidatus Woesearchaeota archaeon]
MPTIIIDRKEFEKKLGLKLSEDKLKEKIALFGTDLDKMDKDEIHVEVFPNRPDMLSIDGFIRSFRQFLELDSGLKKYNVKKSNYKLIVDKSVKKVRPYTACAVVKNLNFTDSKIKEIIQLQEKLHVSWGRNRKKVAIGIYPLEKINFPITYLAKKKEQIKFQPLESKKEMSAKDMLKNHSKCKEFAHLLKDLNEYPLFVDSKNKILSMPPLINSQDIGCVEIGTTDIFIECSGFDFDICSKTLNLVLTTLSDMGGQIYEMEITDNKKIISPNFKPQEMKLDLNYVNKITGLNLKESEVKKLLEFMGHDVKKDKVLIPPYRTDILHQIDLVEDIIKKYGTDNFESKIPNIATIGQESKFELFKRKVAKILIGLQLIETKTFDIVNSKSQNENSLNNYDIILLKNNLTEEFDALRYWLSPCLLEVYQKNQDKEYPQNIFGIEKVYHKNNKIIETNIEEFEKLAISICDTQISFTQIKQIFDYLILQLNIKNAKIEKSNHKSFLNGRCGKIIINNEEIGIIGEIEPKVLINFKLEMPVAICEINLNKVYNLFKE